MKREEIIISKSCEDTAALGKSLADKIKPGTVIALIGDLGSGKTTLTKAIAEGLSVKEQVTSPTFTIVREYKSGRLPLYHFDVYRIGDSDDMFEIGFDEYLYKDGVCIVEWAEKVEALLPEEAIKIHIDYGDNEEERRYRCIY